MEADWEVEVGGDAPVMEPRWPGFVDLRVAPERASQLPETAILPGLAEALVRLNAHSSSVTTCKCDVWQPEFFDPDELDAPGDSSHAIACYIDLLPANDASWHSPGPAIAWCKQICSQLRNCPLRSSRADLIVRRAIGGPDQTSDLLDFGVTAYLTACGPTPSSAGANLAAALAILADSLLLPAFSIAGASKLQ